MEQGDDSRKTVKDGIFFAGRGEDTGFTVVS
jgi:hypothetical protein